MSEGVSLALLRTALVWHHDRAFEIYEPWVVEMKGGGRRIITSRWILSGDASLRVQAYGYVSLCLVGKVDKKIKMMGGDVLTRGGGLRLRFEPLCLLSPCSFGCDECVMKEIVSRPQNKSKRTRLCHRREASEEGREGWWAVRQTGKQGEGASVISDGDPSQLTEGTHRAVLAGSWFEVGSMDDFGLPFC